VAMSAKMQTASRCASASAIASAAKPVSRSIASIATAAQRLASWACSMSDGGVAAGVEGVHRVRGFVVDRGGPFVEADVVEAALDLEGEFEAVRAAGAGRVELGHQLGPELRVVAGEKREHLQRVGGDGERHEWRDRGGQQRDRPVKRLVGRDFDCAGFVGGLVAQGELMLAPRFGDGPVAVG